MTVYRCDFCREIHEDIGEMYDLKIKYSGTANVSLRRNGEYHLCSKCLTRVEKLLGSYEMEVEEDDH